jgi:hypothetical protein
MKILKGIGNVVLVVLILIGAVTGGLFLLLLLGEIIYRIFS